MKTVDTQDLSGNNVDGYIITEWRQEHGEE